MSRRTVSCLVLAALFVLLLLFAPHIMLLVFAGLLFGVALQGGGAWIAGKLGIGYLWGLLIFVLALLAVGTGATIGAAPSLIAQFNELWRQVPEAAENLAGRLSDYSWGQHLLEAMRPGELLSGEGGGMAASALFSTFGALGSFLLILFIGIYLAVSPDLYVRGLTLLFAPSLRARARRAIGLGVHTLRNWIGAQIISMSVVGLLTAAGLWVLGIPLAFILGALAALLAFIPNIGPVIAAVPAVLLALVDGPSTVAWVIAVYVGVQTVESYLITPLIQQESVSLPPALTISVQLLLGALYGMLGLALATPLAALALALVGSLYVKDYLNREPAPDAGTG